jgi:hypothetical protein
VEAHTVYSVPSSSAGFEYRLQGKAGTEIIKAIFTEENVTLLESNFNKDGTFYQSESTAAARDITIVNKKVGELMKDSWSEDVFEFQIEN